jgi:hypothetical protein
MAMNKRNFDSRLARLEQRAVELDCREPTIAEHQWASDVHSRYLGLTAYRKILREVNPRYGLSVPSARLSADERAFVAECDAGTLARADEIVDRYYRSQGITPEDRKRRIDDIYARTVETLKANQKTAAEARKARPELV